MQTNSIDTLPWAKRKHNAVKGTILHINVSISKPYTYIIKAVGEPDKYCFK